MIPCKSVLKDKQNRFLKKPINFLHFSNRVAGDLSGSNRSSSVRFEKRKNDSAQKRAQIFLPKRRGGFIRMLLKLQLNDDDNDEDNVIFSANEEQARSFFYSDAKNEYNYQDDRCLVTFDFNFDWERAWQLYCEEMKKIGKKPKNNKINFSDKFQEKEVLLKGKIDGTDFYITNCRPNTIGCIIKGYAVKKYPFEIMLSTIAENYDYASCGDKFATSKEEFTKMANLMTRCSEELKIDTNNFSVGIISIDGGHDSDSYFDIRKIKKIWE